MHAANRMFPRLHTLLAYNFLMNGPIATIFGMWMGMDIQKHVRLRFYKILKNVGAKEDLALWGYMV